MSSVECYSCQSTQVEPTTTVLIKTGDGTPVTAQSYRCTQCGWTFIVNTVSGLTPRSADLP